MKQFIVFLALSALILAGSYAWAVKIGIPGNYLPLTGGRLTGQISVQPGYLCVAGNGVTCPSSINGDIMSAETDVIGNLYFGTDHIHHIDFNGTAYHFWGNVPANFEGPLTSTLAAAPNFTRITPNLSIRTAGAPGSTAIGTTCTAISLNATYGIPATALSITASLTVSLSGGTATGLVGAQPIFYSENTCTTRLGGQQSAQNAFWEVFSSVTASQLVSLVQVTPFQLYINGATTIWAKKTEVLCTGCTTAVSFIDAYAYTD